VHQREFVTIETTSVTLSPPSNKRNWWRASLMALVGLLALSGFWLTRQYLMRSSLAPVVAAPIATAKADERPRPAAAAASPVATSSAAAPAASAARARATSKATRRSAARDQRARSAASELKLPY
jgi:hypothetical protein